MAATYSVIFISHSSYPVLASSDQTGFIDHLGAVAAAVTWQLSRQLTLELIASKLCIGARMNMSEATSAVKLS
jgi:hypothetical protein